ncbi:hypothetical protein QR680_013950 [Steinernema hermaphroditum]|uniref:Metalloendopeptidase n=1 Tax=Steinernema hermaphroditum TaxID=289476 RepID=A0AA39I9I7_9BILA|nr:hypothetical protein QR680_013950 [Steinernema hermaphroditum]
MLLNVFLSLFTAVFVRSAAINKSSYLDSLWPSGRPIPFAFEEGLSIDLQHKVKDALSLLSEKTCIRFEKFTDGAHPNDTVLFFSDGRGCGSFVGKIVNETYPFQKINLEFSCRNTRVIMHEILHAVGLAHTQCRYDRDEYVSFLENRTQPDQLHNFVLFPREQYDNYDVPYDFSSIMHYRSYDFALNSALPNLIAKDPLYQSAIGEHHSVPAHSDLLLVNRLYGCVEKCNTTCENDGFPNPNNCGTCICPHGFDGRHCADRALGENGSNPCGATLHVSASLSRLTESLSASGANRMTCYWHLQAAEGQRIELKFNSAGSPRGKCSSYASGGTELRLGTFEVGGYLFYCPEHLPNTTIISQGSLVVISLEAFQSEQQFDVEYRSVPPGWTRRLLHPSFVSGLFCACT